MKRPALLLLAVLLAGCGTDVSGPGASLFSCLYSAGTALEEGEVLQVTGADNQGLCLADGPAGEYLYIPFFARAAPPDDEEIELPLLIQTVGFDGAESNASLRGAGGPVLLPDPSRVPEPGSVAARVRRGELQTDWAFHDRLRAREIRELEPRIRGGAGARTSAGIDGSAVRTTALDGRQVLPEVGDRVEYNTAISCTEEDIRTGRVEYISERAIVVSDVDNPGEFEPNDYAYFGLTFDTLVYPLETAHFGAPTDIDLNDRAILFFTRAVNELNPSNASSLTIGFFWSGDLFPDESTQRLEGCPAANNAEMFYLVAPDPTGRDGHRFSVQDVRDLAIPLIGHEFQHLINASRRLFVNGANTFEEPWLNEGLSHAAEELLFYGTSGLEPLQNLTIHDLRDRPGAVAAFNEYMSGNFGNYRSYLARPDTASLMGVDVLATRGATWSFLRYAADRLGQGDEAFFFGVVNNPNGGLTNLGEVLAPAEPLAWMQDWTVSAYGDDFVDGLDPRFTQRSWDLRSLYESTEAGRYPLRTLSPDSDDGATIDLRPGGTAYALFGVPPDGRGVLHVESDGNPPPSTLRGSVLRVR